VCSALICVAQHIHVDEKWNICIWKHLYTHLCIPVEANMFITKSPMGIFVHLCLLLLMIGCVSIVPDANCYVFWKYVYSYLRFKYVYAIIHDRLYVYRLQFDRWCVSNWFWVCFKYAYTVISLLQMCTRYHW